MVTSSADPEVKELLVGECPTSRISRGGDQ